MRVMTTETVRSSTGLLLLFLSLAVFLRLGMGNVVLIGNNGTKSFEDIEASFAPTVKGSGECGMLYVAEPVNACSPLNNKIDLNVMGTRSPFVLIIRGNCSFDDKVRRAQAAGFTAAIIYDNMDGDLVAMAGNAAVIKIHAIFISKASGEFLTKYAGTNNFQIWIFPTIEYSSWSIMAVSFISLLAMSAGLAMCFFIQKHRIRRQRPQDLHDRREFNGMSRRRVKLMPSLKFKNVVVEESSTSATCAICLEDYNFGDKLRMLPCCHKFHASCVDAWLTTWRTFCPVCKRDARNTAGDLPASESTPLLSSVRSSYASSSLISSVELSLASSSTIHIGSHIHSVSIPQSSYVSNTPYTHHSLQSSYQHSPFNASRSSLDIRNAYSQRSHGSYLISPYPLVSPVNNNNNSYISPYLPSPMNGLSYMGSSYIGSSSHQQNPLHCSESATSFPSFNSAQSLPGC